MESRKGMFQEFLEEMSESTTKGKLTLNEAAHPLFLLERENRQWEKMLGELDLRLARVNEDKRWRDYLEHLFELKELKEHYKKVERLFPLAPAQAEQIYLQHLIRSEQEEVLSMLEEISEESFLLGKSTVEKSLYIEHLFLRIRQGSSREEARLFPELRAHATLEEWQSLYYELLDMGYLFTDVPEFFKEEGHFAAEELGRSHLEAALEALEIPLSIRDAQGKRLLRFGKFPMHEEANEAAHAHLAQAKAGEWESKKTKVKHQWIHYSALRGAHGELLGLLERLEEE